MKTGHKRGVIQLAMIVVAVAVIWCIVLPRVAEQPRMRTYLDWLETQRIDPSAMYYTDLDTIDEVLEKVERRK